MKLDSSETKDRAICKHFKTASFIANSHYGTSNMRNHIQKYEHYLAYVQRSNTDGKISSIYDQKLEIFCQEYTPEGSLPPETQAHHMTITSVNLTILQHMTTMKSYLLMLGDHNCKLILGMLNWKEQLSLTS
ncbi:hypothetical protein SOVF_095910 [Spinacia oleracea]|nr:hypothetical protein SOVF_095910 [Spinacia oleracea]